MRVCVINDYIGPRSTHDDDDDTKLDRKDIISTQTSKWTNTIIIICSRMTVCMQVRNIIVLKMLIICTAIISL